MNKKELIQLEKEKAKIEKLFNEEGLLRHYWWINAVVFGKISAWATIEQKEKRFKRFLSRRKKRGYYYD